jgi:Coenzyme PQQ synthesis protein D (PqqD)
MPETYIARSSSIAARALAGEMMVMNAVDSTFYTLNDVATAIWQAADGRTPLSEIVRTRICEQFDIELEQAQKDAEGFVADLSQHGILLVSSQPIPETATSRTSISDPSGTLRTPENS